MMRALWVGLLTWAAVGFVMATAGSVAGSAMAAAPEGVAVVGGPVEASSVLWLGWGGADDHHPMFAVDGDVKTGWAEGAEGDGVGEWVRVHVAPVAAVERVMVGVVNGCQRTAATWRSYGRVAQARVTLVPSGVSAVVDLADGKAWQWQAVQQPAGPLTAVEFRIEGVHRGVGQEHACVAEVGVRLPAGAVDDSAEKARAGMVRAWVKARRAVAGALRRKKGKAGGESLPFAERYVARPDGGETALDCGTDQVCFIEEGLLALGRALGAAAPAEIGQALAQMKETTGWAPVAVVVSDTRPVPPIDGLCSLDGIDAWPCPQGVYLPPMLGFLEAAQIKTTPVELIPTMRQLGDPQTCATYGVEEATFARPRVGTPAALVRVQCAKQAGGGPARSAMQLLVYGADGRLAVAASEREAVVFRWAAAGEKQPVTLVEARKLVLVTGQRTVLEPYEAIE